MTGLLLRLHRTLWVRSMRGNSAAWIMAVLIGLYALLGLLSLGLTVWMLPAEARHWGVAGVVALGTLGYIAVTVIIPSGEAQLRAADFATLPVTARDLLPAMAWSTLLSTRGVTAVVATLLTGVFAVWVSSPWWILVMPVALVVTLLLGEVLRFVSAGTGRVSSERLNVLSGVLVIVMIFGFNVLISYGLDTIPLDRIGRILGWTPVGAAPALVASLLDAAWLPALARSGIVVATLALGSWWWRSVIARRMVAPLDGATREEVSGRREGILLPGLPFTPGAVVYSRGLRYFFRDPRMTGAVASFPIIAIVLVVQGVLVEDAMLHLAMMLFALLSGSLAGNDFGYDGPAGWSHIVTGVPARTLLLARHLSQLTPMLVLVLLVNLAGIVLAEDTGRAALVAVLALGLTIAAAAIALLLTAFNPFATARPGTSPWADRSGFSGAAFVGAFASLLLGWIPVAPGAVLVLLGRVAPGLLLAVALPALFYWIALRAATGHVDRHLPEIYGRVSRWVN